MRDRIYLTVRIALFYAVGAKLGFMLALVPHSSVTLFWPPSGIALAALLLRGSRAIPGIFLGAAGSIVLLLPQFAAWPAAFAAVVVAAAQTLGAFVAAKLLGRFVASAPVWANARDLFFGSVCMGLACILSTSISIASLYALGLLNLEYVRESYGMWWLGEFCGMLIFAPLAFFVGDRIVRRERLLTDPGNITAPTYVYSVFAAAALIGFVAVWRVEDYRITQSLQREATVAANNLMTALRTAGRDLESIRSLMFAREHVSEADFLRYTDAEFGSRHGYSTAQVVGWAPKVTDPRAWDLQMLAGGEPGKEIFELGSDGKRVPVRARDDYFPVQLIYPLEENRTAIGFDLGSEPERRKAIERARDTGKLSMVAPIYLLQPRGGMPGMIMCWPVYREAARLASVTRRREALTGVACGLYQIGKVFNAAVSGFDADIALHLLDKSRPEGDRWYHTRPSPLATAAGQGAPAATTLAALTDDFHGQAAVKFAGHRWLVVATPGPDFVLASRSWLPWGVLGLFLTLGFGLSSIMIERISARKKLREEQHRTEEALHKARAANEAKSYFMAAASHDIKQPLYALGILADTLLMSNPPENTKPIIKSLRKSINEMSQHFDTLMDVGRFQDGSFEVRATTFPLRELARRIALEIGPLCREKGLRWNIDFDDVEVCSDPELLLRLIRNLLINGVRYTEQGGVSCTAKRRGDVVEFTISDTGPGLSPDQQDLVFSEVVHVRPDVIHTTGLGLGLSIVNRISQALGLGMKVSSQEGQGTTFIFRVRLEQA